MSSDLLVPVALALGSNLGDREANLRNAASVLSEHVQDLRLSSFIETAPVGVDPQPNFLNAAAVGHTTLSPRDLLNLLLTTEQAFGRERPYAGAPRTLDLDLILHGGAIIDEPGLIVPHPRFRERQFVLLPLAEVAADWRDPVTGRTVEELVRILTQ
jgi:2-amino-4-hydroxy-6-hydroxymethyldihydropteridine diphosphokinase